MPAWSKNNTSSRLSLYLTPRLAGAIWVATAAFTTAGTRALRARGESAPAQPARIFQLLVFENLICCGLRASVPVKSELHPNHGLRRSCPWPRY